MPAEHETLRHDHARAWPVQALQGLIGGADAAPGEMPPLAHWLLFLPCAPQSGIGPDGHPAPAGALAPYLGQRRMWASSQVSFVAPVPVGAALTQGSRIAEVREKNGRSGPLTFVTHAHEIRHDGRTLLREQQHIVYRAPSAGAPAPETGTPETGTPAPEGVWQRRLSPDETLLMRFSALTYNAHRIHYDRDYARAVEGYPDLVVQGPLTAMLLMDLFRRENPQTVPRGFSFLARKALYVNRPLTLHGAPSDTGARLWAADDGGALAMSAEITL